MSNDRQARALLGIEPPRFRLRDTVRESSLSMWRHPGRSLLTAVGTVLGAAAFVATLGISSTMGQLVSESFDVRRATEVRVVATDADGPAGWQSPERLRALRDLNGVTAAGRRLVVGETPVRRTMGGEPESVKILGADGGALAAMEPRVVSGRLYDDFHERRASPVALLPLPLAERLDITRTGVAVFIGDRAYTVIGIFDDVARRPEALLSVVIPTSLATEMVGEGGEGEQDVLIATVPGAAQLIGRQAPLALWPEEPSAVRSIAPPDPRTLRREVEGNVTRSSLWVSLIALIIGGISIANAAVAGIGARVPEIGLRRAIGGRPAHIFLQLLSETTVLGAVGGLVGVMLGACVTSLTALFNGWTPVLDWRAALLAAAGSAACGLLAGLWPAARAMRITPVAALQR
ncbi:ABC transporter permease [Actinoplanes sp. NPDC049802]|uniref:ABC transporter permease n=1 Tax=Actinoplanes sp. NPDC049802 TaxID=3154742 RepID=UPI0033FF9D2B